VLSLSSPVFADLHAAKAAMRIGDYRSALNELKPLADAGTAEAQFLLGQIYSGGLGTAPDPAKALTWLQQAADQGHPRAQNNLGLLIEQGAGVQPDPALAASWYLKAAEQGRPVAQNNLGRLYRDGTGVPRDGSVAARWFRAAAAQGHAEAENNLGRLYEVGLGVEQDPAAAAEWYLLAAKQQLAEAQNNLGLLYDRGTGVPEDPVKAAKWYRKAAEQGHLAAQQNLASLYTIGRGVKRNSRKAEFWTLRANEQQADGSQRLRGTLVDIRLGTTPDVPVDVVRLPDATPPQEHLPPAVPTPSAMSAVSGTFETGLAFYTEGNYAAAIELWMPLAEAGDQRSQYRLGSLLRTGTGVLLNPAEALRWLQKSAAQGHERAGYDLAFMYFRGRGLPGGKKDYVQAYVWFSISAERGIGDAAAWLEKVGAKLTTQEFDTAQQLLLESTPQVD
jgi:TPR repeat protein